MKKLLILLSLITVLFGQYTINSDVKIQGYLDATDSWAQIDTLELRRLTINGVNFTWDITGQDSIFMIIATGQSNMAGSDGTGGLDTIPDSRVLTWNNVVNDWIVAAPTNVSTSTKLHDAHQPGKNNLAFHFAKQIAETYDIQVRLLYRATGGKLIGMWDDRGDGTYMDSIRTQLTATGVSEVDCILWHQGEANQNSTVTAYADSFKTVLGQFRALSQVDSTVPFIAGELRVQTEYDSTISDFQNYFFDNHKRYLDDPYFTVAKCKWLPGEIGSYIHYSGASLVTMGRERYFSAWKSVPNNEGYANFTMDNDGELIYRGGDVTLHNPATTLTLSSNRIVAGSQNDPPTVLTRALNVTGNATAVSAHFENTSTTGHLIDLNTDDSTNAVVYNGIRFKKLGTAKGVIGRDYSTGTGNIFAIAEYVLGSNNRWQLNLTSGDIWSSGDRLITSSAPYIIATDSDINLNYSTTAQAIDTSAVYIGGSGEPKLGFAASDGDLSNISVSTADRMTFNGASGGYVFDANLMMTLSNPPATQTSTGVTGEIARSSTYLYICTSTNHWKRIALDNTPW